MTSNLQRQRIRRFSRRSGNRSVLGVAAGIALSSEYFFQLQPRAAVFTVNSPSDVVDANPGNGVCETVPGNGVSTLRAAIQEANALAETDQIILPPLPTPAAYVLIVVTELTITGDLTITGCGISTTIIDGNRSLRPDSRVLAIGFGITVNPTGLIPPRSVCRDSGCRMG